MRKLGTVLLAALIGVTMVTGLAACGGEGGGDTATTKTVKVWLHKSKTEAEGKTYAAIQGVVQRGRLQDGGRPRHRDEDRVQEQRAEP